MMYRKSRFPFILLIPVAVFLFGFIVMSLWNTVLVAVLHVGAVTFWQAMGLLILSKILFGGFHGFRGRHGRHGGPDFEKRKEMIEKFQNMTPEERQEFRKKFRGRCNPWDTAAKEETNTPKE